MKIPKIQFKKMKKVTNSIVWFCVNLYYSIVYLMKLGWKKLVVVPVNISPPARGGVRGGGSTRIQTVCYSRENGNPENKNWILNQVQDDRGNKSGMTLNIKALLHSLKIVPMIFGHRDPDRSVGKNWKLLAPRSLGGVGKIGRSPLTIALSCLLILAFVISGNFLQKTPSAHAAWYTTGGTWSYRQAVTIDHTKVPNTDQANFPVLIKITDAANPVFTKALASGYDIMFTASDATTALNYEIEKFVQTEGSRELDAWVKITNLSHTDNTIIYMYYGNSAATAPAASIAQGVWSNGYAGVWHMKETGANPQVLDSTGVNNSTTNLADPTTSGKIDGAMAFTSANSDYINMGQGSSLTFANNAPFTVECWFKSGQTSRADLVARVSGLVPPYNGYLVSLNRTTIGKLDFYLGNGAAQANLGSNLNDNNWHFVSAVANGNNTVSFYIDGTQILNNAALAQTTAGSVDLTMGRASVQELSYLNGSLDEPHISSSARSADWIATEYANQNSPSTFFSIAGAAGEEIGDQVAPSNPTVISGYSTSGKTTPITSGNFYNYPTPYFEWPAAEAAGGAADTGNTYVSGVAGYYSYFGTSCGESGGDPASTHGDYLDDAGPTPGLHYSTSPNVTIPDLTTHEGTYCLRIKTKDNAGNIQGTTWEAYPAYKYEVTNPNPPSYIAVNPAGYSSTDSFDFSWPVASDTINAYTSGIAGYQYKRGNGEGWSATIVPATIAAITSYQTGENIFLVRSVDNAGNTSAQVQTTYYYSADPPGPATALTADPLISDTNSFHFDWTAPVHARPIVDYGYSINAVPTALNLTWTGSPSTSLGVASYATQQGANTLYLVAKDDSGAYAIDIDHYATEDFNCTTVAPPIPTTVSATDSSDRVSARYMLTLQWKAGTNQDPATFDHYSIERSINGSDFTAIATSTSTAYVDASGLSNTVLYYYRIKSVDNADSVSAPSTVVSKMPTGKYDAPPSIVSEPTVTVKTSSGTISWVVNRSSSASIRFGTDESNLSQSQISTSLETAHVIDLVGLLPSTRYYYQVQSLDTYRDYSLESAYSVTYHFNTMSAPSIANVTVSNITLNTADITWETTSASNTKVYYGTNFNYGSVLPESDDSMTTQHSVKLTHLADTTRYHFKIYGSDIDDNTLSSDDYVFDTLPMPAVSTIEYQTDFTGPAPTVVISWKTNVATTSTVEYTPRLATDSLTSEESQSALIKEHSIKLANLLDSTEYQFTVSGVDQFGNKCVSDLQIMRTTADTRPPKISDITIEASNVGSGLTDLAKVIVYWKTDELATSQIVYDEGISGTSYKKMTTLDMGLTQNHIVVVSGLKPNTPYHFQILSQDATSNLSKSNDQTVITSTVTSSVFKIITRTLNSIFGWLGKL